MTIPMQLHGMVPSRIGHPLTIDTPDGTVPLTIVGDAAANKSVATLHDLKIGSASHPGKVVISGAQNTDDPNGTHVALDINTPITPGNLATMDWVVLRRLAASLLAVAFAVYATALGMGNPLSAGWPFVAAMALGQALAWWHTRRVP